MRQERRGRVLLRTRPSVEIEREIVDLLRQVEEGVSVRDIVARLRTIPAVLREDISYEDGKEIAAYFMKLGANTVFTPYDKAELKAMAALAATAAPTVPAAGPAVTAPPSFRAPIATRPPQGWAIILKYLVILALLAACLAAAMYLAKQNEGSSSLPRAAAPVRPLDAPIPSIMDAALVTKGRPSMPAFSWSLSRRLHREKQFLPSRPFTMSLFRT